METQTSSSTIGFGLTCHTTPEGPTDVTRTVTTDPTGARKLVVSDMSGSRGDVSLSPLCRLSLGSLGLPRLVRVVVSLPAVTHP